MPKSRSRRPVGIGRATRPAASPAEQKHRQAMAAYAAGDQAAAIAQLRQAIERNPRVALWHTQLGVLLRAGGHLAEAIAAHRRAIALDPALAAAHNNLGNALRAAGEPAAAEAALREACRLAPRYAEAHCNLAQLLRDGNRLDEAEAMCRRALEVQPDYREALAELGAICQIRGDFAQAETCFRTLCTAHPSDPEAFMKLAVALEALGRFDEADAANDRAAMLAPEHPGADVARARRLEQRGEAAAAAAAYRRVLSRRADVANAYLGLALLPGEGLRSDEKRAIAALLARPGLPASERATLYYALARAAERDQDWNAAFRWARLANELDHARTAFDEAANLDFVERTKAAFPADCWGSLPTGSASERPVFIVGMPRSGTSLVEQIIASHPEAAAGGEIVAIPEIADRLGAEIGSRLRYPECLFDLDQARASEYAGRYLARLDRVSPAALRVTDKLPFNFRHLGLITALFPRARIIHCRRDPRDIAVSCYFLKFHRPISFACDLFEMGAYLRHYEALMRHWRTVLPHPMLEVDYESLVLDPEQQMRRIVDFCDLPWNDRVLRFNEASRRVRTASAGQVHRPIYASSIGRWQRYAPHLLPLFAELEGRPLPVVQRHPPRSRSTAEANETPAPARR